MIKGINRQVIEISDTGNTYYEKAWLIVKPEYTHLHHTLLEKEAKGLLAQVGNPSCMKAKRHFGFWAIRLGISAAIGALLCLCIQQIF